MKATPNSSLSPEGREWCPHVTLQHGREPRPGSTKDDRGQRSRAAERSRRHERHCRLELQNSNSIPGEGINTSRSVNLPFDMVALHLPIHHPCDNLTRERAIYGHGRWENWSRIAGDTGVRHSIAELAVCYRNNRLARRVTPRRALRCAKSVDKANRSPVGTVECGHRSWRRRRPPVVHWSHWASAADGQQHQNHRAQPDERCLSGSVYGSTNNT